MLVFRPTISYQLFKRHDNVTAALRGILGDTGSHNLTISQGETDEPIECSLETRSLVYPGSYVALSYQWGTPEDSKRIRVKIGSTGHG